MSETKDLNKLLTKIDIKSRNGMDATSDLLDFASRSLELIENASPKGLDTIGLIQLCNGIIELCKISTAEYCMFKPIWHMANEVDKLIAIIDPKYDIWENATDDDIILDDLPESELLKSFICLFSNIKNDVNDIKNKIVSNNVLLKYRLKIYDHCSAFTYKQMEKDIEQQKKRG